MHKGLYWDDVTKKVYPWDELIKLLRERDYNTIGVFKRKVRQFHLGMNSVRLQDILNLYQNS